MICLDDLIRDPRNVYFAFVCHVMLQQLHTSAQLYMVWWTVCVVNCFYDTGTRTHQTVVPYPYRRSETVTWSQAQKQHEKHGGLYNAWSFTCLLLSYGQYGTLSTSLFSFLRVIAHPAATHCNILWHSWPWCLKSIPHHDHAFKEFKLSQDAPHPEWLQNQDVNKHRFCRQDGATQVDYLHSSSEQSNFNTRSNSISTSSYIHTEHCNFK